MSLEPLKHKRDGSQDQSTVRDPKKPKTMAALESSVAFESLTPSLLFQAFESSMSIPMQKAYMFLAWFEPPKKPDFLPIFLRWTAVRAITPELLHDCFDHFGKIKLRVRYETTAQAAVTFGAVRRKAVRAGRQELALEAARRELDYLVIMCLRYDLHLDLIPDFMTQIEDALGLLEHAVRPPVPAVPSTSTPPPTQPPALGATDLQGSGSDDDMKSIRLKIQLSLRNLESSSIVPLSKLYGVDTVVDILRGYQAILAFAHIPGWEVATVRGLLLHGVQGTGKTALALGFAKEAGWAFYDITSNSIFAKYVGEAETFIRVLFEEAERTAPSVIFIDEIDAILGRPSSDNQNLHFRIHSDLKKRWSDALEKGVRLVIIGATNNPGDLQLTGFGRRFQEKAHVRPPNQLARCNILKSRMESLFHNLDQEDFERLASMSNGLTGSDLCDVLDKLQMDRIVHMSSAERFTEMQFQGRAVWVPWIDGDDQSKTVNRKADDFANPGEQLRFRPFDFASLRVGIMGFRSTTTSQMWDQNVEFERRYSVVAE